LSNVPDGIGSDKESLCSAFCFGRIRFENDLYTAVAMSEGIDDGGILDMAMVEGVEKTADYLRDRQGQPVVIVDTIVTNEGSKLFNGYIATLAVVPEIVGLHKNSQDERMRPGIAINGACTSFQQYVTVNNQIGTHQLTYISSNNIALASNELVIGKPDINGLGSDGLARQEVIAGEDIVPWIVDHIGRGENGYDFYFNIVNALSREKDFEFKQLEPLLVEPFVGMAQAELEMLEGISRVLGDYRFRVENANRMLAGYKGEANLALLGLASAHPQYRNRIPRTSSSYPAVVTSSLDDSCGEQVEGRTAAVARHIDPLAKLINVARQKGML
jgi:hypothetical protein